MFLFSAGKVGISWNLGLVLYYLFVVVGGVLIQGAIFLIVASLSFYFIKTSNIKALFYDNARKFAGYPISIYPRIIQIFMMYVVPFAFVNYFPVQFFLRKSDLDLYPRIMVYISPLVGVICYLIAYMFWRYSFRQYKSSGN